MRVQGMLQPPLLSTPTSLTRHGETATFQSLETGSPTQVVCMCGSHVLFAVNWLISSLVAQLCDQFQAFSDVKIGFWNVLHRLGPFRTVSYRPAPKSAARLSHKFRSIGFQNRSNYRRCTKTKSIALMWGVLHRIMSKFQGLLVTRLHKLGQSASLGHVKKQTYINLSRVCLPGVKRAYNMTAYST